MSLCLEICNIYIKLVMRLPINKTKGYFQTIFFMKNSKFLPKYHLNFFPKSQFSSYINPCLVILFWEVQNQNKQKGTSRCLYQIENKRPRFLTQKSDSWQKQIWKYCNISWKTVKTCHTFIYWEPHNKLGNDHVSTQLTISTSEHSFKSVYEGR